MQRHVPGRDRQADFDRFDQAWLPLPGTNLRDAEDHGHLRDKVPVSDREVSRPGYLEADKSRLCRVFQGKKLTIMRKYKKGSTSELDKNLCRTQEMKTRRRECLS